MKYEPAAGDLVWADFDPRMGREQGGRRPALVISEHVFWEATGMAVVCPITSNVRPFPSSTVLPPGLKIQGEILTGQLRSIDTLVRLFKFSGVRAPPETLAEVRAKLALMTGIA
jgi:mRNA interferase MazF